MMHRPSLLIGLSISFKYCWKQALPDTIGKPGAIRLGYELLEAAEKVASARYAKNGEHDVIELAALDLLQLVCLQAVLDLRADSSQQGQDSGLPQLPYLLHADADLGYSNKAMPSISPYPVGLILKAVF